jgi:hypothetical protein
VRDERVADDRPTPEHEVEDAIGQTGVDQRRGEVRRRERDNLRRLPDDGVAICDCGRDLPGRDGDREVPRRDRRHDAERFAPCVQERQRRVARICLSVGLECLARVVAEDCSRTACLAHRFDERLSLFTREVTADRLRALVDEVGRPPQHVAARRWRGVTPGRERSSGSLDRLRGELWPCQRHRRHMLLRCGRVDVGNDLVALAAAATHQ